jgi:hypothetical protein
VRIKGWWLTLSVTGAFLLAMSAQELSLRWRGNELHVAAPRVHFLTGKSLTTLKNGVAVPFDFQLTLWSGNRSVVFDRVLQRFVLSYDLWEEKFSILKQRGFAMREDTRTNEVRRSASGLSSDAAEAWCMDTISLSTAGLPDNQPIWVKLDIRGAEPKEGSPVFGESGLSIASLIELFSRPPRSYEQRWSVEAGPVRLEDIKRLSGRGT